MAQKKIHRNQQPAPTFGASGRSGLPVTTFVLEGLVRMIVGPAPEYYLMFMWCSFSKTISLCVWTDGCLRPSRGSGYVPSDRCGGISGSEAQNWFCVGRFVTRAVKLSAECSRTQLLSRPRYTHQNVTVAFSSLPTLPPSSFQG